MQSLSRRGVLWFTSMNFITAAVFPARRWVLIPQSRWHDHLWRHLSFSRPGCRLGKALPCQEGPMEQSDVGPTQMGIVH